MTKNEFVEACSQAGYCRKEEAKYWAEKHPKASYDENDMVDAYHAAQQWAGSRTCGLRGGVYGVNGKTTVFRNGVRGNGSGLQDWKM